MTLLHPRREPFSAAMEDGLAVVENAYVRCVHDPGSGGGLSGAFVKNGSNENMFVLPQSFIVGITERGAYHTYKACDGECRVSRNGNNPVVETRSVFRDAEGKMLEGLSLELRTEYTPWGEALFRAVFDAGRRISDLGMVQVGTLYASGRMDTMAVQESLETSVSPYMGNCIKRWEHLTPSPRAVYESCHLPLSFLMFERGVEGFQVSLGDDLTQWESIGGTLPGLQFGYAAWNARRKCYEIRFSPLDCRREGQYLEGRLPFDFSIAFPFVREKMAPLSPCSGNLLFSGRGFEHRWPTEEDFARLKEAGVTLMRVHNDGDAFDNGIFWRDCAYPPYPPDEMAKMDEALRQAGEAGISVAPYFSLHEYHPEAAGFSDNAEKWGRIAIAGDRIIPSYCGGHGFFGYQMCLKSGWLEHRIKTIDEVLSRHAFDSVYYDWCSAKECLNPSHGPRHWDLRELMKLLEWSYDRVGEKGAVYLHLTREPNIAAGNIASLVLTEEQGGSIIGPEMFSPHAHFMNVTSRQVCCMLPGGASDADHRRYALCALLHHATVSMNTRVYTDFYAEYRKELETVTDYARHTAPGERRVSVSDPNCGMSAYWNDSGEIMLFVVNLAEEPRKTACSAVLPCGNYACETKVPPLSLKVIRTRIS